MKHSTNTAVVVSSVMERIHSEYSEALAGPASLQHLFHSEVFDFEEYCRDFYPHPDIGRLKQLTLQFAQQYGILLPNAENYITCVMFLFPQAPLEKITRLSKNYAIDFYLNDTMGRETKPTEEERKHLYEVRDRLSALSSELDPAGTASLPERANIEVLAEIGATAPGAWFDRFLRSYLYHINVAHKTHDAVAAGAIQTVEEYIEMRNQISGMPHTIALIEYCNDRYLDWGVLREAGMAREVERINDTVSLIGALTNDLFSFEKEVIDHNTDSNLLPVIILNNFRMRLTEAISVAGSIIRDLLIDYTGLFDSINNKAAVLREPDKETLAAYLRGLKSVLQACWTWQKSTKRYKRDRSVWVETGSHELVTR